jgi:hypothetical protein
VVHTQRPRSIAVRVVQPHQQAVRLLVQRVVPQQPLGARDRLGLVAGPSEEVGKLRQRRPVLLAQPLAILGQPLVVGALEQVAAVERNSLAQRIQVLRGLARCSRQRILERRDVEPGRRVGAPAQRSRRQLQKPVRLGQAVSQDVQHMAQVGAGLLLGRVGPEQEGEALA